MPELKEKLNKFILDTVNLNNFEDNLINSFSVIEASEGWVKILYQVKRNACNQRHILHGGASAAFTDIVLYLTWASGLDINEKITNLPFTVSMNINYLSTIKIGESLIIDSRIEKKTGGLMFISTKMFKQKDNSLLNSSTSIIKLFTRPKL